MSVPEVFFDTILLLYLLSGDRSGATNFNDFLASLNQSNYLGE